MKAYKNRLIKTASILLDGDLEKNVAAIILMDLQIQKGLTFDLMNEMTEKAFYSNQVILDVAKKIIKEQTKN